MNNLKVVGFDVDDVLIDFVGRLLYEYNTSGVVHPLLHDQVTRWNLDTVLTEQPEGWWKWMARDPQFFQHAYPVGLNLFIPTVEQQRKNGWRAVAVTHAIKESALVKYRRFMELYGTQFTELDYIETADKTLVCLDYMLDDKPSTIRALLQAGVMAYLFDRPWNHNETDLDAVRVYSISQYLQKVETGLPEGQYGKVI